MKAITIIGVFFIVVFFKNYQQTQLGHGRVYGSKPDTTGMMDASKVESFMDKKIRISVTIKGKVLKVTKSQGGWFEMGAGDGKIIHAHFSANNVSIPSSLAGKIVMADGIAQKQLIADDGQHFAGDTVTGKHQHGTNANPKNRITFEVKGLEVF